MNYVDYGQAVMALTALALQLWATALSKPLKAITPPRIWTALVWLNLFIMSRRALSVSEILYDWSGQTYETVTVCVGLGVSISMLMTIFRLRLHLNLERQHEVALQTEADQEREKAKQLVKAALELAQELKRQNYHVEDTDAYKLAMKFSEKQ